MFGISAPPDQVVITGSSLTIEELTGRRGGQPRRLLLQGGGLPFMGAEWGSEMVMKTTWYPGNAEEATQQVLVPIELPSTWEGAWRRTTLSRTPAVFVDETGESIQIIDPYVLREAFEDMHRMGARLRVTWAVSGKTLIGDPKDKVGRHEDVRIIREGRVKQFVTPIERHTDIRWRATFEWMSRGGSIDRVARTRQDDDAGAAANALQASIDAAIKAADAMKSLRPDVRLSASALTLGKLEALANLPQAAVERFTRRLQVMVNDVRRAGEVGRKFANAPLTVGNSLLDFARNTTAIANQFADEMGRAPPELLAHRAKVSDLTRSTNHFSRVVIAAQGNARTARDLAERLRRVQAAGANTGALNVSDSASTRAGDIIGVYIAKEGDTPQSVSLRYYKNPDHGVDILRANRLPWHTPTFARGQKLVIPVLTNRPSDL